MVTTHIPGYPRIGARRELKFALEAHWRGEADEAWLLDAGAGLRAAHWRRQREAGLSLVTAGDFSLYDPMLDLLALLGCPPARFGFDPQRLTLRQYFELARGNAAQPALEMTKWFDTNYHYLVPELSAQTRFDGGPDWYFDHIGEALAAGHPVKPALIGPVTFLRLAKGGDGFDRLDLLEPLARAYARILGRLRGMGIDWVQIDEPALCLELEPAWLDAFDNAYRILAAGAPRLLLTTYFDSAGDHAGRILRLPVQGIHLDLVRAPEQLAAWQAKLPRDWVLSAGIVDGRNVWRTDLRRALALLQPLHDALGDRLWIAPSCSLQHVPVSLSGEQRIDPEVRPWLAFADEKLDELRVLGSALEQGPAGVQAELETADAALESRRTSRRVLNEAVRAELGRLTAEDEKRASPHARRSALQQARLQLPPLPTTTIGSFPQTPKIRGIRAAWKRGETGELQYLEAMRGEIREVIARQEALGIDVLVHGEAERNDMVEFFGEQLWGFCFTQNGWVQSYGSRCVKPPVIYGDVARPEPMTVSTARYAQSLTGKPVKGMLTGPVTILQWSFVRDDQPREHTALQIALAVREEVADLEKAGIRVIQIDEPALREGLPLKRRDWGAYLDWAVRAFRIAAAVAADETQIHTHMCYAEFNDILPAIAAMDADVITIETSRSNMALLDGFGEFRYPNDIGPGVYDIHSPRIPQAEDMLRLLQRACRVIPPQRLWINPDCGLKTRSWSEVEPALRNMVAAARRLREQLAAEGGAAGTAA
ncbi:MAG: 5-methyltetrahydropteroyltriglutamate--homocysteine S-methyltransferase [Burkholderiales bacterium]|nr:5-methyltetrahydropteroyltriglutamate--homocysteine S-methyltransferase [Burkholderiales bacterium]